MSHRRLLVIALLALAASSCRRSEAPSKETATSSEPSSPADAAAPVPGAVPPLAAGQEPQQHSEPSETGGTDRIGAGELLDLGPAAPAAASTRGVVMIPRSDVPVLVPYSPAAAESRAERAAGGFAPFGRPPAILGDYAYWIHDGRLLRRQTDGSGELQVLATDAVNGTRVAGETLGRHIVGYIAKHPSGSRSIARLWVEGRAAADLSPGGSAASSVSLASDGSQLLAFTLEGRSGMSPLHTRRVRVTVSGVELGEDKVVWVAGPAQATTEVTAIAAPPQVSAFIPLERDITRFGLARISLAGSQRPVVSWREYPNGLEPSPVATGSLCGGSAVLYVRPSEAAPHAPQELHLAWLSDKGLGPSQVIASARKFASVSMASRSKQGFIAYVADRRTWARLLRCKTSAGGSDRPVP